MSGSQIFELDMQQAKREITHTVHRAYNPET